VEKTFLILLLNMLSVTSTIVESILYHNDFYITAPIFETEVV